jgi:3',5'-cyclic AMP phosphodiesterase CpdA
MRCISWLHISDIHMRACDAWPQQVVMTAMCADIRANRPDRPVDFVLVTGDLAYGGQAEEYDLVKGFLDELSEAADVPIDRIFCIPGNHDIDRDRQQFCFQGARAALKDSSSTDAFLGSPNADDFRTLMARQENYRTFQKSYFAGQERAPTADELGYVAHLVIDEVRVAIIGLDTAWLANGGIEDHMKLLLGERQILNALALAIDTPDPPHIVVAMGHHPLHLLQDFDRRAALRRVEEQCHFYHCGHLHEPEARSSGQTPGGCLTVASGASFETRQSHNTYSVVRLDLHKAERTITTHRYSPGDAAFNSVSTQSYRMEVQPVAECDLNELAEALAAHGLRTSVYYLAALLLEKKSEVPVPTASSHTLASMAALEGMADSNLQRETLGFLAFRNVLRVLYGREDLATILATHGASVMTYSATLSALCEADPILQATLDRQEADARSLASVGPTESFSHTIGLWQDLADAHEWDLLREHVEPHVSSSNESLALPAKRMLALASASSSEHDDRRRAVEIYRELVGADQPEPSDAINLARILVDLDQTNDAKAVVLAAIRQCPVSATDRLGRVGQEIVEATGDRSFRDQLKAEIAERGSRE